MALAALVAATAVAAVGAAKPRIGGAGWDDEFGPIPLRADIAKYARLQQARQAQRPAAAVPATPYAASGSWAGGWGLHTGAVIAAPGVDVMPSGKFLAAEAAVHPRRRGGLKEPAAAPPSRRAGHAGAAQRATQQALRTTAAAPSSGAWAAGAPGKVPALARAAPGPAAAPHGGSGGGGGGETWMERDLARVMEDDRRITGEPDADTDDDVGEHAGADSGPLHVDAARQRRDVRRDADASRSSEGRHHAAGSANPAARQHSSARRPPTAPGVPADASAGQASPQAHPRGARGRAGTAGAQGMAAAQREQRGSGSKGARSPAHSKRKPPLRRAVLRKAPIAEVTRDIEKRLTEAAGGKAPQTGLEDDDGYGYGYGDEDGDEDGVDFDDGNPQEEVKEFETDIRKAFDWNKITFATIPLHQWAWSVCLFSASLVPL